MRRRVVMVIGMALVFGGNILFLVRGSSATKNAIKIASSTHMGSISFPVSLSGYQSVDRKDRAAIEFFHGFYRAFHYGWLHRCRNRKYPACVTSENWVVIEEDGSEVSITISVLHKPKEVAKVFKERLTLPKARRLGTKAARVAMWQFSREG